MQISHRERVQSYQAKHNLPSPDEYVLLLLQCIASGQVEADQIVAHVEAGDLNQSIGDGKKEGFA
jgi:hypothetical protein